MTFFSLGFSFTNQNKKQTKQLSLIYTFIIDDIIIIIVVVTITTLVLLYLTLALFHRSLQHPCMLDWEKYEL